MADMQPKFNPAGERRSILVIEDEQINREMLGLILQETYRLIFAQTGARALEILEEQYASLSLVLLDLHLPDMEGTDILRRIKEDVRTVGLPVVVLTADQEAEVECLKLGATDFIPKPYPKREVVLARILRTVELFEDRDVIHWTERDHVTGLYNPEFFFRYATQFDLHYKDAATDAIVMDINYFHILNERFGKELGDEALKRIAGILLETVGKSDGIVCRRGSDTFLIYCLHRTDYEELAQRASVRLKEDYQVRVRMGVYPLADRRVDLERRFDRAKQAADTVRHSFFRAVGVYDNAMYERELFDEQLIEDFDSAIREKQFTVYYQPKFDIRPPKPVLCSAEALIRWTHPRLGMISPGRFIPLFEENGLIRDLDLFVWKQAAAQIREWKETLGQRIPVSVNVSRIDLNDPHLLENLVGIAEEAGLDRGDLLLEITESAYTEDSQKIIQMVEDLRDCGFPIEMDDFGTGYSSLNMLTALPIDALKLDMQFIRTAFSDRRDTRLLNAVLGLAGSLGLLTVAEGVETEEQLSALKAMGCDLVQGYYFSKPLPAGEFEAFVRQQET